MRIAITHDYLNQSGGAERVLSVFHFIYPDAPIYTSITNSKNLSEDLCNTKIHVSWIQKLPFIQKHFKKYFFLYPIAFKTINFQEFEVVLSSCSAYSKMINKRGKKLLHICYCHAPARFIWNYQSYTKREKITFLQKIILPFIIQILKRIDLNSNKSVDYFIANSTAIQKRIKDYYNRDSIVIFPPVNTDFYQPINEEGDYFLVVSRLAAYKRIDLAVDAFNNLTDCKLLIIGDGPDRKQLEKIANSNITFAGRLPDIEVREAMAKCKAFIFPGEEDFGITPLEVNACGRPVIAFKAGGALDTVIHGKTGIFFEEQTIESLCNAIIKFPLFSFNKSEIRNHAQNFDTEVFKKNISIYINNKYNEFI